MTIHVCINFRIRISPKEAAPTHRGKRAEDAQHGQAALLSFTPRHHQHSRGAVRHLPSTTAGHTVRHNVSHMPLKQSHRWLCVCFLHPSFLKVDCCKPKHQAPSTSAACLSVVCSVTWHAQQQIAKAESQPHKCSHTMAVLLVA